MSEDGLLWHVGPDVLDLNDNERPPQKTTFKWNKSLTEFHSLECWAVYQRRSTGCRHGFRISYRDLINWTCPECCSLSFTRHHLFKLGAEMDAGGRLVEKTKRYQLRPWRHEIRFLSLSFSKQVSIPSRSLPLDASGTRTWVRWSTRNKQLVVEDFSGDAVVQIR